MKLLRRLCARPWIIGGVAVVALLTNGCGATAAPVDSAIPTPARASIPTGSAAESGGAAKAGDLKRTSEGGSVTLEVTWEKSGRASEAPLRFAVGMNTHSVDLDGIDLSKQAVLRTDSGQEVAPERWEAPAGGHHRSGTLTFPATVGGGPLIGAQTKFIELVVRDVAGVKERRFKWEVSS